MRIALDTAPQHLSRLVGKSGKMYASRASKSGFYPDFPPGLFPGPVIPVTSHLVLQWLHYQAPGDIGSALGLTGPVSIYCDWTT